MDLPDLQLMLDDEEINAILFGRGGYGVVRIIDQLDFTRFVQYPKWLLGYSDITCLHSHIHTQFNIATIHGHMGAGFRDENKDSYSTHQINEVLKGAPIQYEIAPNTASCGARVIWNGTMEWDEEKHEGSTVLATVPNADNPDEGKLLREMGYAEKAPVAGSYKIGDDGALTLITEYETMWSEERLWFASPNLRMRVSVLKRFGGFSMASFTSEIRMGSTDASRMATEAANTATS